MGIWHVDPVSGEGIRRHASVEDDQIVAVHQFTFGHMAQNICNLRRGLTHNASGVCRRIVDQAACTLFAR